MQRIGTPAFQIIGLQIPPQFACLNAHDGVAVRVEIGTAAEDKCCHQHRRALRGPAGQFVLHHIGKKLAVARRGREVSAGHHATQLGRSVKSKIPCGGGHERLGKPRLLLTEKYRIVSAAGHLDAQGVPATAFQIISLQVAPQFTRFNPHNGIEDRVEAFGTPKNPRRHAVGGNFRLPPVLEEALDDQG